MKGRRVLVSGGAGVIGLEMIPKLVARGALVLVGDLKPRPAAFPTEVRYRQGDLNSMTRQEVAAFAPDMFIHLAATFERSTETPEFWSENFHHNVRLSNHLMTLVRDTPSVRRVVFASSYLIYDPVLYQFDAPRDRAVSLTESDPIRPRNLVGMAKLAHEMELRFLTGFADCRFSALSVRIYRGYGRNSRDVISRWVRALLAGETISVYRPEGRFDYIYAKDSAEGLIRLAEADQAEGVINLGGGRARPVSDVVEVLRRSFPGMKVVNEPSDIPFEASQADTALLRRTIGWIPEYDLERSIPEIIAYERERQGSAQAPAGAVPHVLVTSAAAKIPLIRAMRSAAGRVGPGVQVVAGDIDPGAPARHVADAFWQMPRAEPGNVEAILAGCRARGIGAVLPTRDGELVFWADVRARFAAEGISVVVSGAASVRRCLDKLAFARFGAATGLPVIPAALTPDGAGSGPYVVKERVGAGSRGIGLNLDRAAALAHAEGLEAPIFQPFVAGQEISVDAWMDQAGSPRGVVLRRRDRVVNGESQVTTTFRSPGIEAQAVSVLRALGLRGPAVMQAIVGERDSIQVIEVNPRFGGASTASIAAGLDTLYWSLSEAIGPEGAHAFERIPGEIRQLRVARDLIIHDPDL